MAEYLIVDDEPYICEDIAYELRRVIGAEDVILKANSAKEALRIAAEHDIYVVFLDIDMPEMNGLQLSRILMDSALSRNIIFVTGYPDYSLEAWETQASGFLVKPVQRDKLSASLERLRHPRITRRAEKEQAEQEKLEFHCFGTFEILYRGKPVYFRRKKGKEFMAFLIDRRGAMVTAGELRRILWDESDDTGEKLHYIRVLAGDIRRTLNQIGQEHIFLHEKSSYGIDLTAIDCDFIDYLSGDPKAVWSFREEYMSQYSWAEVTLASLVERNKHFRGTE